MQSRNNKNFFPTYDGLASNESLLQVNDKSMGRLTTMKNDSALRIGYGSQTKVNQSKVAYRQMVLPRDQLVEMRKTLLEKCEEVMSRMNWPFGKNNLKTEKVFKDLV